MSEELDALDREIAEVEATISRWQHVLRDLRDDRRAAYLRWYRQQSRTGEARGRDRDSLYYLVTDDLIDVIKAWMREYDADHGNGSQIALAKKAVVSDRSIRRLVNRENKYVTVETTDRILTAIGMFHIMSRLELYRLERGGIFRVTE